MSKTDDQIRSEIETAEYLAEWGAWGVVFGLIVEVARAAATSFGYENKTADNWGAVVADCLIAIGVIVEIRFGRVANEGHAELRSRADGRAAALEKEAAGARERVAEIERLTAWRQVSAAQTEEISSALHGSMFDTNVLIEYQYSDPEAWSYSLGIANVFAKVGVASIRRVPNSHIGRIVFGLRIAGCWNKRVSDRRCIYEGRLDCAYRGRKRRFIDTSSA